MATKVLMPKLGLTMEEGSITKWIKKERDRVEKGENILEIMTDKANFQVEAPESGVLLKIIVSEDTEVPVGTVVGIIGKENEDIADVLAESTAVGSKKRNEGTKGNTESATNSLPKDTGVKDAVSENRSRESGRLVTPRARKLAEENGVSLQEITGSGSEGLITEKDIKACLEKMSISGGDKQVVKLSGMRKVIAERLSESQQKRVHIHLTIPVDMTDAVNLRKSLSVKGKKVSYNDFIIKALAVCLKEYSWLNSSLDETKKEVLLHSQINIGLAVATEDEGLLVPVVTGVDGKNLWQIAQESRRLVEKAKVRKLTGDETSGGTFTVTNLGMYGIEQFTAVINPPESAILAVGIITEDPTVSDGNFVIRSIMKATLGVDHRIVDGSMAARFLKRLKSLLEAPRELLPNG